MYVPNSTWTPKRAEFERFAKLLVILAVISRTSGIQMDVVLHALIFPQHAP